MFTAAGYVCVHPCAVLCLIAQSYPTLWSPMDCTRQAPLSMGILQAGILEWVAMSFSRVSSQSTDWTRVALKANSLLSEPRGKPVNTGVGSLSLLQGIFLTEGSNQGLPHCRWILYQLSYYSISYIIKIKPASWPGGPRRATPFHSCLFFFPW